MFKIVCTLAVAQFTCFFYRVLARNLLQISMQMFLQWFMQGSFAHMETIGDRIRLVRGKLSQDEFSKRFGVHRNTLARWESGERSPDFGFIQKMTIELGLAPEWVLVGVGTEHLQPAQKALRDMYLQDQDNDWVFGDEKDKQHVHYSQPKSSIEPLDCQQCRDLRMELSAEREKHIQLNSELTQERILNRELVGENRQLWKENGDLRVELTSIKARADPDSEEPSEAAKGCA